VAFTWLTLRWACPGGLIRSEANRGHVAHVPGDGDGFDRDHEERSPESRSGG
jgi:hypothetical protein